jgi:hypothetical protein
VGPGADDLARLHRLQLVMAGGTALAVLAALLLTLDMAPMASPTGARPHWRKDFGAEAFIWAFVLGAVLFAVTLDFQLAWPIWLAGVVIYQIQKRIGRPRPGDGFSDGPA